MKVTVIARRADGLEAALKARTARQRERLRVATTANAEDEFNVVQSLVPRDTNFMADHTLLESTHDGLGYNIGYRREQFVDLPNPVTGQPVTAFYPPYVIHGTRFMAGNDFLTAARFQVRDRLKRRYTRALSG